MNLAEILPREAVLPNLAARDRDSLLAEMTAALQKLHPELAAVDLAGILREREELGSTAMGDGVAIPHGKVAGIDRALLAVGRSPDGVDFNAPDNRLCHVFFLILAPESEAGAHLRLLAQLARRLKDPVFRSEMLLAETREQLWQAVTAP